MSQPFRSNRYLQRQLIRLCVFAIVLLVAWLAKRPTEPRPNPPPALRPPANVEEPPTPSARAKKSAEAEDNAPADASLIVRNLVLRDEDRNVVYRGEIDLQPTLERIAANRKLRFAHDGADFENRERRLPRQPSGYYREWVVPTPGERGPGPQRLVIGEAGEVWYTADHYRTFRPIRNRSP
jgi:ribonuclease T1